MGTGMGTDTDQAASVKERSKRDRMKHLRWALPAILLVVLIGGVYLNEVRHCRTFHPTGDDLFDRYAEAVIARQGWRLFTIDRKCGTNPATLPDELLEQWESDFGDDPRYWQLRYWCTRYRHELGIQEPERSDSCGFLVKDQSPALRHLETARERGVADAETLLLLYREATDVWFDEIAREHGAPDRISDMDSETAVAVNAEYEERIIALLNEAVTLGPDEAWPYWERGLLRLSWGDEAAALGDLTAGNACAINVIPMCFPFSTVVGEYAKSSGHANRVLNGAILEQALENRSLGMHQILGMKSTAKEQVNRIALSGGYIDLTDALHHTFCRMAVADRNHGMHQYSQAVYVWILADANLELRTGDLDPEQAGVLTDLIRGFNYIQRKEEIRTTLNYLDNRDLDRMIDILHFRGNGDHLVLTYNIADHQLPYQQTAQSTPADTTYCRLMCQSPWRYYERLSDFWPDCSSQNLYNDVFEILDLVDYQTLSRPESWEPNRLFID